MPHSTVQHNHAAVYCHIIHYIAVMIPCHYYRSYKMFQFFLTKCMCMLHRRLFKSVNCLTLSQWDDRCLYMQLNRLSNIYSRWRLTQVCLCSLCFLVLLVPGVPSFSGFLWFVGHYSPGVPLVPGFPWFLVSLGSWDSLSPVGSWHSLSSWGSLGSWGSLSSCDSI